MPSPSIKYTVLFTNGPELLDNTYRRYLLKTFRDFLPFKEVPIKPYLRAKERDKTVREKKAPRKVVKKQREVGELWDDV